MAKYWLGIFPIFELIHFKKYMHFKLFLHNQLSILSTWKLNKKCNWDFELKL